MLKKSVCLLLIVAFAVICCGMAFAGPAKVGIMTGTTSQGEEEYRAAQEMIKKYGEDRIIHVTYPEQCCPSPYHAYPGALGIEIPEGKAGDVAFIHQAIEEKILEGGGAGRFATWKVPINMAFAYAATDYAFDIGEGKVKGYDRAHMEDLLRKHSGEIRTSTYAKGDEKADNFILVVGESIIYGADKAGK